ncbi:MAG: tRNA lysidine(34) synthetase TilS, partial [Muribaculaceae bacterium]|nr:tRNA lysidine(34) synthetase TilS [Muribaculaceae bacterium]
MHEFEHKIKQLIDSEGLLPDGGKVIVGLSGGADSVALLSALRALNYRCVAAHCNFSLRGKEADRDQHHAQTIAMQLDAEWRTVKFDTKSYMQANGVSAEMACRELRYEWFNRLLEDAEAEAIAVAHHRDDNVETFLLNLLRGAGIHGLRGMKPRNGHVIRPMLNCTRAEVTNYLSTKGLTFVTDSTNLV